MQAVDSNSKYFYASMKDRKNQNQIRSLLDSDGNLLHTEYDIKPYWEPQQRKCLTRQQQLQLIKTISREEIHKAMLDIYEGKAPGCDGCNAYFSGRLGPVPRLFFERHFLC